MKLYYSPGACSLAADIVLHEMKTKAEFIKVDLRTKQTAAGEDFKAINPKGYVPTLVLDDGDILTENVALLQYLASLDTKLLPQSGREKWHAIEALAFVSTEIHKSFKPLFTPGTDDATKAKTRTHIAQRLELAAAMLGDRKFIVGNDFTVVDAYLFVMLMWSKKNEVTVPEKLRTYADELGKRPSVREALTLEGLA